MNMTAALNVNDTKMSGRLYVAFELGQSQWQLAFTIGLGQAPRLKNITAGCTSRTLAEIAKAKERFGLPADAPVVSCYEAGREGFWLHRWLTTVGVANVIVDSSSIEVNRRKRRAKSDRLDALKLVAMLVRYHQGERKIWSVIHVPSPEEEDRRHFHRQMNALKEERTALSNAMQGLLYLEGIGGFSVKADFAELLERLRTWDDKPVPTGLRARLLQDFARWQLVDRQIKDLENARKKLIRCDETPQVDKVRRLLMLKGIGLTGSWHLNYEMFGWRNFRNRKQVGAVVGLTPTPYSSGKSEREQGISKAGSRQMRWLAVELGWSWVRHQPNSELTKWYRRRWDQNSRLRKIGIVAVARKLLIALWRYVDQGEVPVGAELVAWEGKLKGHEKMAA
jgi:transposase